MKKVFVVLVVLFIGILFAGCTSQQSAPAATPTPTPTIATPVPTNVPTPIATPTPNVTANATANVTANVTAVPTAVPAPNVVTLTFTRYLTISPVGTIYVPVGTVVSWVNADPLKPHGIKSVGTNSGYDFGTVKIPYNSAYNVTFSTKGAYQYVTVFQPYVNWKIVVS
jgi:plastocyanin